MQGETPFVSTLIFLALQAAGREVEVQPGADLAAAIARAGAGGTVVLAPGRYPSGQITIGPSLPKVTVRSKAGGRAQIDFESKGGFYLKADGVILQDLDILNAQNFGVDVDASDCALRGCKVLGGGGDAVKLSPGDWKNGRYNRGAMLQGCEIGKNRAFEGVDCVGQDDVRIIDCHFHDTPGWGVYLKGGASRGLVEGCVFERCGTLENNPAGGVCLGEHTGPDEVMTKKHGQPWESVDGTVRNCVFLDIPSAAMAAWCARNPRFVNNTCVNVAVKDRAAFIVLANHGLPSAGVTFANNVVVGSKEGGRPLTWIYDKGATGKLTFENNCWFGGSGKFWNQAAGSGPVDFARWQSAHGFDGSSLFADPQLDASAHLRAGSPCIDKGKAMEGFALDFDKGRRTGAWDIGADEFGSGTPRPLR